MLDELTIAERRRNILAQMKEAADWAGRDMNEITLIAVSKKQPDDRIANILVAGQTVFGENRVQEAQNRWGGTFAAKRPSLDMHFIGPLQSNKVENAVQLFDVIETLDREKLAGRLMDAANKTGRLPRLLVQVNTGEEPQKSGVLPSDLPNFLKTLYSEYKITPEGLMCIPPVGEAVSPHFWFLKNAAEDHGLKILSMGMSGDFQTAIKIGATHVRVGSALFGERLV